MPHDPRTRAASVKFATVCRRKASTEADRAEARRDLAAVQIEVSIDRAMDNTSLPLTTEQTDALIARITKAGAR